MPLTASPEIGKIEVGVDTVETASFPSSPNAGLYDSPSSFRELHDRFVLGHLDDTPGLPEGARDQIDFARIIQSDASRAAFLAEQHYNQILQARLRGEAVPDGVFNVAADALSVAKTDEIRALSLRSDICYGIWSRGRPGRILPNGSELTHQLWLLDVARNGIDRIAGSEIVHYESVFVGRVHRDHAMHDLIRPHNPSFVIVVRAGGSDHVQVPRTHEYRVIMHYGGNHTEEASAKPGTTIVRTATSDGPESVQDFMWFRSAEGGDTFRLSIFPARAQGDIQRFSSDGKNVDTGWLVAQEPSFLNRHGVPNPTFTDAGRIALTL